MLFVFLSHNDRIFTFPIFFSLHSELSSLSLAETTNVIIISVVDILSLTCLTLGNTDRFARECILTCVRARNHFDISVIVFASLAKHVASCVEREFLATECASDCFVFQCSSYEVNIVIDGFNVVVHVTFLIIDH